MYAPPLIGIKRYRERDGSMLCRTQLVKCLSDVRILSALCIVAYTSTRSPGTYTDRPIKQEA